MDWVTVPCHRRAKVTWLPLLCISTEIRLSKYVRLDAHVLQYYFTCQAIVFIQLILRKGEVDLFSYLLHNFKHLYYPMFRHRTMRFGSVQPTKLVTPYDGQAINRADVREKIARNANNSPDETANCGLACKTSNYNVHRLSTFIDKQDDRMGNTHDCSLDTKACATDQRQSLSWRASSTWKRSSSLKRGFEISAIFKLVVLVMLCLASAWTSAEPQFNRRFGPPVQRTRHGIISLFNDNASNPTDSAKVCWTKSLLQCSARFTLQKDWLKRYWQKSQCFLSCLSSINNLNSFILAAQIQKRDLTQFLCLFVF